jgi:uncharacterized protein (TIGR02246 family)
MKTISRLSSEITTEIVSLLNDFVTKWNTKDLERFGTVFTDDAEYIDITGQIAVGKRDILEQHRFPFEVVNKRAVFGLDNIYIRAIAPTLILVTGNWVCENSTTPKGDLLPVRSGVIQVICRKEVPQWKISLVHNTDLSQVYTGIVNTELRFHSSQR